MVKKGKVKRVFPGNNTSEGFYSYYDYIIDGEPKKFFVIKGGPGVGKSSFIKKIGEEMAEKGYDVEFHHCSSDNQSLDGIAIPDLKIAIIDGTAPHVVDPKYPAAIDTILNFGEFWNEENIRMHRDEILAITFEISKLFQRAYRFLAAAKFVRDDMEDIYEEACHSGKINQVIGNLIEEFFGNMPYSEEAGRIRHLFGSAYTPGGHVDYYETIIDPFQKVIYINGAYVRGISSLLQQIADAAVKKGLYVEAYHEPLVPRNIETLIIPKADIAITTSEKYRGKNIKTINFEEFMDRSILERYQERLAEDQHLFTEIVGKGLANIRTAKEKHDVLEKFYIANMDFEKVEKLRERIVSEILMRV